MKVSLVEKVKVNNCVCLTNSIFKMFDGMNPINSGKLVSIFRGTLSQCTQECVR
ncbi:MAG: hypothetical protein JWR12_3035 [Mucilaginibacter sp.]|nr:hypothetical protein [Mucilaginibacter sp.]